MTDVEVEPVLYFPMRRVDPLAPAPEYAELRKVPPARYASGAVRPPWLVTRHEDVRAALMDARLLSTT